LRAYLIAFLPFIALVAIELRDRPPGGNAR
jgi:hypothetical protein